MAQTQLPEATKELFYQVLETARVGSLSEEDRLSYESDLKNYRDTMSCIRFARKEGTAEGFGLGFDKGVEEGRKEGRKEGEDKRNVEIAKFMKAKGMESSLISECTGLPVEEIEKL